MIFNKRVKFLYNENECLFRTLTINDVTESYVQGLKSQKRYLVNNLEGITKEGQQNYIKKILMSEEDTICGLFVNNIIVGSAGLQNLNKENSVTLGIFVFDSRLRGKGYGKTLVWSSCYLAHNCMNICNFYAGMEKDNIPSLKSFLSCGFKIINENEKYYKVKLNIEELKKPNNIEKVTVENFD